jgi:hypothetical protein
LAARILRVRESEGILLGVGAALALVGLLILQAAAPGGLLGVTTRTSATTQTYTTTVQRNSTVVVTSTASASNTAPSICGLQQEVWGPDYNYAGGGPASNSSYLVPVLLMQPNSTGYFCVVYDYPYSNYNASRAQQFEGFTIYTEDCQETQGGIGCAFHPSKSFVVGASILNSSGLFVSNATAHYVGIMYSVKALSNSTGFYGESAPLPGCSYMPMAVGYTPAQLNASDFYGYSAFTFCGGGGGFHPVEVGVVGIQVTVFDMPSGWPLG